ncbi:phenolic glucoside malonyltransferase 1-like isoform X4 [Cucumis melo]|uniref:Phenolic glucoside malonyltransferase 1-like isoform X3 n=1 Tax=Cucumis melo TaxID=3656 RepID=A0ABM3KF24_CUCME|nr:phenolic glucoside malonyltransferase 1-like isoform X3 [Cucumis melo]XP_050936373.1 phenolic glucoside malonyltransferase 1-like isoform X4 [Cucumis melo]
MANFSSLKLIDVCKVSPSPTAAAPSSLPLTFFDLMWLRFHPIQRLLFYEFPSNEISFHDTIVPKLKSSLSLTLRHYLPLAGNLVWPSQFDVPVVEFVEGDGVSMTVAEFDGDFNHLSGNGFREVLEFHPLVPELPISYDRAAVIAIQVTKFQNKGFSIGITNHHAIIDGRSSTSFIKSWAQICMEESSIPTPKEMPLYDRSVINDPKDLAKLYAKVWQDLEGPNNKSLNLKIPETKHGLIRSTLEFTHQNIQKLKEWILNEKIKNENFDSSSCRISSFAIATAYLCICTAKLEGLKEGKLWFGFAADGRTRLKPQVPLNYFGNCLVGAVVCLERFELLSENGIILACDEISKAIRNLDDGALNGCENWGSQMSQLTTNYSKVQVISLSGSPRFGVYNADFGFGKPKKVEIVSAESPYVFSLTDSRNSDVVMEIGVVKERDEIEAFVDIFNQGFEFI